MDIIKAGKYLTFKLAEEDYGTEKMAQYKRRRSTHGRVSEAEVSYAADRQGLRAQRTTPARSAPGP